MMIVLISCGKKKAFQRSKARDLYQGTLFKLSLKYAESLNPERIFILSAKYGLLSLEDEIDPYDQTLKKMPKSDRIKWAERIIQQLIDSAVTPNNHFVFLAGESYRQFLLPYLKSFDIPLKGLPNGKQLHRLQELIS